ncbi:MAG: hypothetical protein QXO51_05100 [Halobacteria archaeon]
MTSDKARDRKKKTYALVMFAVMFMGIFVVAGVAGLEGVIRAITGGNQSGPPLGSAPTPTPAPPPLFRRNLTSFADALSLTPSGAARVSFTSDRGLFGSDFGAFVGQRHTAWTQIYGSPVSAEVRILLPPEGLPLWLHGLSGPAPRPPPAFTYRNATLIEFFPGQQPWLGIATNLQPLVAGVRLPGPPAPPYIAGLDPVLDVLENGSRGSALDRFGDLARRLPPEARFAGAAASPIQGWDNRSVFGVVSEGNESYRLQAYLAGGSPNEAGLEALRANATAAGTGLLWGREAGAAGGEEVVRIEARGNWSQVRAVLSSGGFLLPGE